MQFSAYQLAIFDFVESGEGSAIIDAKAGAGKTTCIVECCNRVPSHLSVLFLAFNKSIVEELKHKLPRGTNCSTFNSCGWRAWLRFVNRKFVKIDAKKTWRIISDNFKKEDQRLYGSFVAKLTSLAKAEGLTPSSEEDSWLDLADYHGLYLQSDKATIGRAIFLAQKVLKRSIEIATTVCDFDDQLYMPWFRGIALDKYDFIFVDEAQDTNPIQAALIKRMIKPDGRVIAVGDPKQCIYGFRGADHHAVTKLSKILDATWLPLSISYRCSQSVIREAQKWVPEIEAFELSPEGEVQTLEAYEIEDFSNEDAILCRNNAPLIEMAYQIISRGKSINFLGRDIGGGLKALIKRMEASSLDDLEQNLADWIAKESERLVQKRQEEKIELLQDKVKCIQVFIDNLPQSKATVSGLIEAIDALFKPGKRGITLSSVHKSKGKEWGRVFILGFDKYMPSSYAKKEWQKEQESNLIYVAITRAKNTLTYIPESAWKDSAGIELPEVGEEKPEVIRSPKGYGAPKKKMKGFNPFC